LTKAEVESFRAHCKSIEALFVPDVKKIHYSKPERGLFLDAGKYFCSVSRTRVRGLKVPRPRVRAFTSIALLFFFVGLQILTRGLIGEYVGRIYMVVRRRPKYVTKEILE